MIFVTLQVIEHGKHGKSDHIFFYWIKCLSRVCGYRLSSVGSHERFTWYSSNVRYVLYEPEGQRFHLNPK